MPGYRIKHERVAVRDAADLHIRSLLDRQQFADPLGDALAQGISSASWPLFGLIWPSALQLAALMAVHPLRAGERILEIGCGLALASLVAHRRGADVTASDCHPLAAAFLDENLRLNALAPLPYRHGRWAAGARAAPPIPLQAVQGQYDLVMGSDLLYERDESGAMAEFIATHCAPDARVCIVDPDRGNRAGFNRRMAALGFLVQETPIRTPATTGSAPFKGRLLSYRRAPAAHRIQPQRCT